MDTNNLLKRPNITKKEIVIIINKFKIVALINFI